MRTQIEETIKKAIRIGNYLTGKSNEEENPASLPGKDEDPSNEKVVREVLSKQNVENSLEQYKRLNTGLERDWKKMASLPETPGSNHSLPNGGYCRLHHAIIRRWRLLALSRAESDSSLSPRANPSRRL